MTPRRFQATLDQQAFFMPLVSLRNRFPIMQKKRNTPHHPPSADSHM